MDRKSFTGPMARLSTLPAQSGGDPEHRKAILHTYHERLGYVLTPAAWAAWVEAYMGPVKSIEGGAWLSRAAGRFLPTVDEILADVGSTIGRAAYRRKLSRLPIPDAELDSTGLARLNLWQDPAALDAEHRREITRRVLALPEGERSAEAWARIGREVRESMTPERMAEREAQKRALPATEQRALPPGQPAASGIEADLRRVAEPVRAPRCKW